MNKILSLLAIVMLAVCPQSMLADDVQWTDVSTAEEFYSTIRNNHSANVRLTADIDLSKHTSSKDCIFNFEFKGKINGKYTGADGKDACHVLKNSAKDLLFNYLTNAEISDIAIQDCSFDAWDTHSGWLGTSATGCTFKNIVMANVDGNGMEMGGEHDRVGGLIGVATNSTFDHIIAMDVDIEIDGFVAGCIAGKATGCTFSNILTNMLCSVYADGNEEGVLTNTSAYNGGIVGYALNSNISKCVNMAFIGSNDDRTGGILGFGKGTTVIDCTNQAIVAHMDKDDYEYYRDELTKEVENAYTNIDLPLEIFGGTALIFGGAGIAIGYYETMWDTFQICLKLSDAYFTIGAISGVVSAILVPLEVVLLYYAQDPDEIGGIAGHMQANSSVIGCTNGGYVFGADAHVGGIVGYLKESSVTDCWNRCYIKGDEQTGGIVGTNDNGSITSCLNTSYAKNKNDAPESARIQGYTKGTVTLKGNCYSSYQDGTDLEARAVSWESLNSGSVAAYMNLYSSQNEKRWTQKIGSDCYPSPTAVAKDTVPLTNAGVVPTNLVMDVSTDGEFFKAICDPCVHISLSADIDMKNTSTQLYPRGATFYGTINGNGHTLKNAEIEIEDVDKRESLNGALFAQASHATFENLTVDSVTITQENVVVGNAHTEAVLVATSNNCKYNNVHIKNSTVTINKDKDYLAEVGGLVAISSSDTITDCSMESTCKLQGYSGWKNTDTNVGGIASKAYNSIFTRCYNAAKIWADDNQEGGIAAYAENCTIDYCLNTGGIIGQENVGGICGNAVNTAITNCVNTGWIDDDDNKREDKRSGIVGVLNGSKATVANCINFGSVNYADDDCSPINNKRINGATYGEGNLYYCQFNGKHIDNTEDESKATYAPYAKMISGEYAHNRTDFYQHIDAKTSFPTNYPVPIPAAGTVFTNVLCDGTMAYSNIYNSTEAHEGIADEHGECIVCGRFISAAAPFVHLSTPNDLVTFANNVNDGGDYSQSVVYLDNDIDMSGHSFIPAGSQTVPFKGIFDGLGHRISYLSVNGSTDGVGLFGCVAGANTIIRNVIIDSSSSVNSSAGGVAGLVGCVKDKYNAECNITIQNCGNEAGINGHENTAGILGAVYWNDAAVINIQNCYNTGDITGTSRSATIVGYARRNYSITNCYNAGSLLGGGVKSDGLFYLHESEGSHYCANCYDINQAEGSIKKISKEDVTLGVLCENLNANRDGLSEWGQNIGTDTHPVFSTDGIHCSRTMQNQWGTICLPFDIAINAGDNFDFYELTSVTDDEITLQRITEGPLKAGTPVIIRRDASVTDIDVKPASTPNITTTVGTGSADKEGKITLTGVFADTDVTSLDGYIISNNAFWNIADIKGTGQVYCDAFHAYLAGTVSSDAKQLTIGIDDNPTAVQALNAITSGTAQYYDLSGRRVNGLQNGVNIVRFSNGATKKVIIK